MAYNPTTAKAMIIAIMEAGNAASDADDARDLIAAEWADFFTWLLSVLDVKTSGLADTNADTLIDDTTVE